MRTTNTPPTEPGGQLAMFAAPAPSTRAKYQRSAPQQVAPTSIQSYREEQAKGTFDNLRQQIMYLLANGATMTRRQLAKVLKKEPGSLCYALSQLQKKNLVEVAFCQDCPTTGKLVSWFRLCPCAGKDG